MKIIVIGAGGVGSYLCHVLCKNGRGGNGVGTRRREEGGGICVRFGIAHLSCGFLPSMPDEGTKAVFSSIFTGKYQPVYVSDMDGWYNLNFACKLH